MSSVENENKMNLEHGNTIETRFENVVFKIGMKFMDLLTVGETISKYYEISGK